MDGTSGGTLANYLASYFIARHGFTTQVPPEAADLVKACDVVLTSMSWGSLHLLCFVDGQTRPGKQFGLPPERVREIAKDCRKYCGSMNFTKMPITIEIVEISNEATSDEDRRRLRHYRRSSIFSKAFVFAARIDAQTKQVWRNRWRIGRSRIERILQKPIVPAAELRVEVESRPAFVAPRPPVVTYGILAALVAVFVIEISLSGSADPSLAALISFGGLNAKLVAAGEWWRTISATVLHANVNHIVANGLSLYIGGKVLENMVGRTWFAATYAVAGICGSLASLAGGAHFVVSVGASGAIMGVIAAAAICGLVRRRQEFGMAAMQLLISGLVPTLGLAVWGGKGAANVDHFAHFGGALGGAAVALAMLALWRRDERAPHARAVAAGIAGIGCLALACEATEAVVNRPAYAVVLMPNGALAGSVANQDARAPQLVQQYPDDPRPYFALGLARLRQNDAPGAEKALRAALGRDKTLMLYFDEAFANRIRGALAGTLMMGGNRSAAREAYAPLCALPAGSPLLDNYSKQLRPTLCN
jgi:rhomboid protease GluP